MQINSKTLLRSSHFFQFRPQKVSEPWRPGMAHDSFIMISFNCLLFLIISRVFKPFKTVKTVIADVMSDYLDTF